MSAGNVTPEQMLSDSERDFVISRLLAYARHEGKKLANAREKPLHPELVKTMREKMVEATRLAMKLQGMDT